ERLADAVVAEIGMDAYVDEEPVDAAIPGHVGKADELLVPVSGHMGQAALEHRVEIGEPVDLPGRAPEIGKHLLAGKRVDPDIDDVHLVPSLLEKQPRKNERERQR